MHIFHFPAPIPKEIIDHWDIIHCYCLKEKHLIFRAAHKQSKEEKIFQLIAKRNFSSFLWKHLLKIQNEYLLLPDKVRKTKQGYLLSFPCLTTLPEVICSEGLSIPMILQLMLDMAEALQALHGAGIYHLDIKADNVYFSGQGNFVLGDFSESILEKNAPNTRCRGTPGYTAPECLQGSPRAASDQYSLGILCYALCNNGILPPNNKALCEPAILSFHPDIGRDIFTVILKMTSPDPSRRFHDFEELQTEINAILSHDSDSISYHLQITDDADCFLQPTEPIEDTSSIPVAFRLFRKLLIPILLLTTLCLLTKPVAEIIVSSSQDESTDNTFQTPMYETPAADANPTVTALPADAFSELDIAGRNINSFLEAASLCTEPSQINILYGENNQIEQSEEAEIFRSIQELYLSNNRIQDTSGFRTLQELSTLVLSDNSCTDLSGLADLQQLRFLDLSGNRNLNDITPLSSCRNLNVLILTDTAVTESSVLQLQTQLPECNIIYN